MRSWDEAAKRPRRAAASFAVSWDGRLLERRTPAELEHFRQLASEGLLDELCLTFHPSILGGKSAPAITGPDESFLPRGVALDLLKLEPTPDGFLVRYRVRSP